MWADVLTVFVSYNSFKDVCVANDAYPGLRGAEKEN